MPTPRVNGGIISDQMLTGHLRYFKVAGSFAYTVSDGTVTLDSSTAGGTPDSVYYFLVGENKPVPGSLADWVCRKIMDKCTIVEIGLVGDPGAETELHFSAANTSFGWIDDDGNVDVTATQDAIAEIGPTLTVPTTSGGAKDDITSAPITADVSTTVTITEVPFNLA